MLVEERHHRLRQRGVDHCTEVITRHDDSAAARDGVGQPHRITDELIGVTRDDQHRVERALGPCRWAWVNAALMLYDAGASEAETHAYLERWGLMTPEWAAHTIRFLTEPTTRTYVITYAAGADLCESYVAGQPERLQRLLTEQVRVRDLLEAGDEAHGRARSSSTRPPLARAPRSAGSSR